MPQEAKAAKAKAISIFDRHHPVIELVIPLLSLRDVLSLEQACRSLKNSIQQLTGPLWQQKLSSTLPGGHPLLLHEAGSYSRASVSSYSGIQQGLRSESWPQRAVDLQQILTVSVSPDDRLLLLVGDSGSFLGFVRLYDVRSGRLVQSCSLSPIWTDLESGEDPDPREAVHWARHSTSQSGLVLVRGRGGYNHVVSFGPEHLAIGQSIWGHNAYQSKWAISSDGTVLANFSGHDAELCMLKLYDRGLQRLLSFDEDDEEGMFLSSFGSSLMELRDPEFSIFLTQMHCKTMHSLLMLLSEADDCIMDLEWMHWGMGVLALGAEHLFIKDNCVGHVRPWQHKRLADIEGCASEPGEVRQASWCPDNTSVMLLGPHGVLIWDSNSDAVVAHFCSDLLPRDPDACHIPPQLAQCSPDFPGMLAVLDYQHLGLLNIRTGQAVHTISFPSFEEPRSLAWNRSGSQLRFRRGSSWHVVCFGAEGRMRPAERMVGLLLGVREHAGSDPSQDDVHHSPQSPAPCPLSRGSAKLRQSRERLSKPLVSRSCCVNPSISRAITIQGQSDMHAYFSSAAPQ